MLWGLICLAIVAGIIIGEFALRDRHRSASNPAMEQTLRAAVTRARARSSISSATVGRYQTGSTLAHALGTIDGDPVMVATARVNTDPGTVFVCPTSSPVEVRLTGMTRRGVSYLAQAGVTGPINTMTAGCP